MRNFIVKIFLRVLNSNFVNGSPAKYGFMNGFEGWSYESLQSEVDQQPYITVKELLKISDQFKECMKQGGNCVIEGDKIREMNDDDIVDIQNSLDPHRGIFRP